MKRKIHYAWVNVLAGLLLAAVVAGMALNCFSLFVIPVSEELDFSRAQMGVCQTINALGFDSATHYQFVHMTATMAKDYLSILADVKREQEFVAKSFAFRCTLNEACNVNEFDDSGGVLVGVVHICKKIKALIGNGYHAHVGLNGAKGIVCAFRARIGQCVKKCAFSHVGKSYDTKFHIDCVLL